MSISSCSRRYIGELVAILIDGDGLQPNMLPRPVVKQTTLAPPATCPVADTGSYPGVSMKTKPFAVTGSAYFTTSNEVGVTGLCHRAQGFLEDRRQSPSL